MATQLSREKASQAWCKPTTSNKVMDTELAEAFAEIIDEIKSQQLNQSERNNQTDKAQALAGKDTRAPIA